MKKMNEIETAEAKRGFLLELAKINYIDIHHEILFNCTLQNITNQNLDDFCMNNSETRIYVSTFFRVKNINVLLYARGTR